MKWNPRRQDKDSWIAQAEALGAFIEKRPGKREALFSMNVERRFGKQTRRFRLVIRLIERTISKHGQHLLLPDIELEGWWTSLDDEEAMVIEAIATTVPMSNSTPSSKPTSIWNVYRLASLTPTTPSCVSACWHTIVCDCSDNWACSVTWRRSGIQPSGGGSKQCYRKSCIVPGKSYTKPDSGGWIWGRRRRLPGYLNICSNAWWFSHLPRRDKRRRKPDVS